MNISCPEGKLTSNIDLNTKTSMEVVQGGSYGNVQLDMTKTSFKDDKESAKPSGDDVAPPSLTFSATIPVHQDIADATAENRLKCGRKYRLIITLGGVLLVVTITALAIVLTKEDPVDPLNKAAPLPHLVPYQPFGEGLSPSRIIGGSPVEDSYPYMVLLLDELGSSCGGSLIARDVILTAATCSTGYTLYGYLGAHDLNNGFDEGLAVKIEVPHPNYNGRSLADNDFMLLFLEGPSSTETVKLNSYSSVPTVGQDVWTMGWGDTDMTNDFDSETTYDVSLSTVLNHIEVQVLSNEECDSSGGYIGDSYYAYSGEITDNMLCAKDDGQDACQGDGGGPLVIRGYDGDIQVGIISGGFGCAEEPFPGVYARVSEAYEWIQGEVCARSNYASEAGFDCSSPIEEDDGNDNGSVPSPTVIGYDPCIVCPNGLTVGDDFVPSPEIGNVYTCQQFVDYGMYYETDGSDICEEGLKPYESICCPAIKDPCNLCPYGLTGDADFVPYPEGGNLYSCGDLPYVAAAFESDSKYCGYFGVVEQFCCP